MTEGLNPLVISTLLSKDVTFDTESTSVWAVFNRKDVTPCSTILEIILKSVLDGPRVAMNRALFIGLNQQTTIKGIISTLLSYITMTPLETTAVMVILNSRVSMNRALQVLISQFSMKSLTQTEDLWQNSGIDSKFIL
jgi:hypothetical protein